MLVITGLMRSGTSAAAQAAHELGVHMGTQMLIPPTGRPPEWEDLGLALGLSRWALAGDAGAALDRAFMAYAKTRDMQLEAARMLQPQILDWGFKSPLLMLYWDEWVKAQAGRTMTVVLTQRSEEDARESLHRWGAGMEQPSAWLDQMVGIQEVLESRYARIVKEADFVLPFEALSHDRLRALRPVVEHLKEVN